MTLVLSLGRWECPWHQCDICGKEAASFCEMCPSSYCKEHREGMLFISKLDGKLSCSEHDPCGPDPLEPGEIREYVPNMTSVRPGAMAVPVTSSLVPDSRRASSSASPVSSPAGQAALGRQEAPPRLYINTKTATSSFIPSSRPYLTDRTEGKAFSTPTSSKDEREDGEVEDGEVCGLEVEEVEDDDDEEVEEEEDEMEEMEIVEDEEEEPLYGGDLLEEDEEEDDDDDDNDDDDDDDEGGDVYDTWGDYVDDDADDGEVEGEDLEEWGRVEDDGKWLSPSIPLQIPNKNSQ